MKNTISLMGAFLIVIGIGVCGYLAGTYPAYSAIAGTVATAGAGILARSQIQGVWCKFCQCMKSISPRNTPRQSPSHTNADLEKGVELPQLTTPQTTDDNHESLVDVARKLSNAAPDNHHVIIHQYKATMEKTTIEVDDKENEKEPKNQLDVKKRNSLQ